VRERALRGGFVAYRMIRAMTLVALGALAAGCGGGPGPDDRAAAVNERPPASSDDAPSTSDEAPPASSDDAPPANADAPGGSVGAPGGGGGGAEAACRKFCNSTAGLSCEGAAADFVDGLCEDGCQLPPGKEACDQKAQDVFTCAAGIAGLCTDENADVAVCNTALQAVVECLRPAEGPPAMGCTTAGGCECANDCDACNCALPGESGAAVCPLVCM
jgi:hypothetical protein